MTLSLDLSQQPNSFFLNLEAIKKSSKYPSFVRLLASRLIDNPTMSTAHFFTEFLSEEDFQILNTMTALVVDKLRDPHFSPDDYIPEYETILLLTWMLATAESSIETVTRDDEATHEAINAASMALLSLVTCVSLHKKGLVKIYWENMTLGTDMNDRPIVSRIR